MINKYKILLIVPIILLLDQWSKAWVVQSLVKRDSIPIIPNFFDIVHVTNKGAAFGIFRGMPESIRHPFFCILSLVAILLIILYYTRLKEKHLLPYVCLSLILGGAIGNLWDRFARGEVVDFLSIHWYDKMIHWQFGSFRLHFLLEWPAFNVADSAITLAVVGFALFTFRKEASTGSDSCDRSSSR